MQIFSISFRKRNFSVEFTEIPLADLVVGWRRFSPEEIFPGNIYTGYGKLFMQEKKGSDFKNDEKGIHVFKEKFQEILNWFETKEQGDNLILVPARDLPPIPVFENIEYQIKKTGFLRSFFAVSSESFFPFWIIGISFNLMLLFLEGSLACLPMNHLFVLIFACTFGGCMFSYIFLSVLFRILTKINGGPFRKGDIVQVIHGKHAGKIGRVYEEWSTRNQVRVAINEEAWKKLEDVFSHIQLIRIKRNHQ